MAICTPFVLQYSKWKKNLMRLTLGFVDVYHIFLIYKQMNKNEFLSDFFIKSCLIHSTGGPT